MQFGPVHWDRKLRASVDSRKHDLPLRALRTELHAALFDLIIVQDVDRAGSAAHFHRFGWHNKGAAHGCARRALATVFEKSYARAHLWKDARILLPEGDAHFDGGLGAICRGNNGDHLASDRPVGVSIQAK